MLNDKRREREEQVLEILKKKSCDLQQVRYGKWERRIPKRIGLGSGYGIKVLLSGQMAGGSGNKMRRGLTACQIKTVEQSQGELPNGKSGCTRRVASGDAGWTENHVHDNGCSNDKGVAVRKLWRWAKQKKTAQNSLGMGMSMCSRQKSEDDRVRTCAQNQ